MYKEIDFKDLKLNDNNLLLLVTATSLETQHLHNELKPFDRNDSILKINNGNYTYYIGEFGNYLAAHVQCGTMGSISRDSSITTISDAITLFSPKITLMIGIAFGIDDTDQNIGDVLVSECITPYNFKKVQSGSETIRTNDAPASKLLINKFKNALGWEFLLKGNLKAKNIIAPILSGEELINDVKRRNELVREKPTAKGGEMEGVGLYFAADGKCEWILVKGICDFADGNKDKDKDANQILAMQSAVSLCKEVFSSKTAFETIGLSPIANIQNINITHNLQNINQVLFDRYDDTKEEYYLNREIDKIISSNLKIYSLWVYGKSGRGKSNIVLRNIIKEKLYYIMVSLGNCTGLSIDDFFKEIFIELSKKLEPKIKTLENTTFQQSIKDITSLLERHFKNKEVYIIIDEIPLGNDGNCKAFTEKICSLFISNSMHSHCTQIKYVLSSIYSPISHISEFNQKIYEMVKFIEIEDWEEPNCSDLVNLIEEKLEMKIEIEVKKEIINSSEGSPRFIKKIFKNSITLGGLQIQNYKNVISETKRELN
jgi:nucleoside phosphorylase